MTTYVVEFNDGALMPFNNIYATKACKQVKWLWIVPDTAIVSELIGYIYLKNEKPKDWKKRRNGGEIVIEHDGD